MPETTIAILPCNGCSMAAGGGNTAVLHQFTKRQAVVSEADGKLLHYQLLYRCRDGHERVWGTESV